MNLLHRGLIFMNLNLQVLHSSVELFEKIFFNDVGIQMNKTIFRPDNIDAVRALKHNGFRMPARNSSLTNIGVV